MNANKFKVVCGKRNKTEESGEIVGPDAYSMARNLADRWAHSGKRCVRILRADSAGINADKFFLYQIVRP